MPTEDANFRYLNREGRWADFRRGGLRLSADGSLQLQSVPRLDGVAPVGLEEQSVPDGPSGIAVDVDGSAYISDTARGAIVRHSGCDGRLSTIAGSRGVGGERGTRLERPRGLVLLPHRRALLVADSGNHRLVLLSPDDGQLLDVWAGDLAAPWAVAVDKNGSVYVVDHGNRRVQKFGISGDADPHFWRNVESTGLLKEPSDLAVVSEKDVRVYVVDAEARRICVFDADGHPSRDASGAPVVLGLGAIARAMGIVATSDALYIGDNDARAIVKFGLTEPFERLGTAFGYLGPVAALTLSGRKRLLVHTGDPAAPVALTLDAAYRSSGLLWSRAISVGPDNVDWFRAAVSISLPDRAHARFFVRTSTSANPPQVHPGSDDPFPADEWRREAFDVTDFHLGGAPSRYLWIGAQLLGDGLSTPVLRQIRVEFNHAGYPQYLPAIFREDSTCREFLIRFLGLFESFFAQTERQIAHLPDLFDPAVVPEAAIAWLARWLALDLNDEASPAVRRRAIADAFALYARRGTLQGLRDALLRQAGVHAVIYEPVLFSSWWALPGPENPGDSILGVSTMLASAHAQGAVLGSSAVLDRSHVIAGEDFATPLFDDVAHQFTVQVYRGEVRDAAARQALDAVLEREKPAHTIHHLCFVEPRMRIGFQARLGIDTVVAGGPEPTRLGDSSGGLVLGGQPRGRIGEQSGIGTTTRL